MNAKKLSISIFLVIFILFSVFSFVSYDVSDCVDTIVCFEGSYAHKYAEENEIPFELIPDSDAYIADLSLEHFDYNFSNGEGEIVSYTGDSEKIAIPTDINGNKITKIREGAFDNTENLEIIYIPKSVKELEIGNDGLGGLEGKTLYMYEGTSLYRNLYTAFTNTADVENSIVKVKTIPDSYYVNFYSANIPFSYNNLSDSEIEITHYNGDIDLLCVPQSIDGKAVTAISFDALEQGVAVIVIPESVKEIKTDLYCGRYDEVFALGMVLALVAFVLSTIFVATIKKESKEKVFLKIPQIMVAFISLVLGLTISGLYLFSIITVPVFVIGFIAIYGISIIVVLVSKSAAKEVVRVEEKVKTKTFFVKALTVDAETLVSLSQSAEIKAEATKVYEAIRYSDPMSNDALSGEEAQISLKFNQFRDAVNQNNIETVKTLSNELLILIKDRNSKCKLLK